MSHVWLFVRHGQSAANAEGWLAGHHDAPLTEAGRAQARALGQTIAGQRIDRAFASDLTRAVETARLVLAERLPITIDPRLRERHLGRWEQARREELRRTGQWETLLGWDTPPPGGESQRDVARRLLGCLAEIEAPGTTLVVSHGTALRSVIALLDQVPTAEIGRQAIGNAELIERVVPPGTWAALARAL